LSTFADDCFLYDLSFSPPRPTESGMPISYETDHQSRRVTVVLTGIATVEDLLAIVNRQAAEGTWGYGLLYDARRVTREQNGAYGDMRLVLQQVSAHAATLGARGPVAIVTDNPADYSIVRTYSNLSGQAQRPVEVFRDPSDAERWLTGRDDT
jgi:hypothetical protein